MAQVWSHGNMHSTEICCGADTLQALIYSDVTTKVLVTFCIVEEWATVFYQIYLRIKTV